MRIGIRPINYVTVLNVQLRAYNLVDFFFLIHLEIVLLTK